ncbi:MAG: hypothetical protein JXA03_10100 [Bacteroidales bacterium]|nr:hypothetical protein [Bacteroidales bacterium]
MKKILLFVAIITMAACGQRMGAGDNGNAEDFERLKEFNKKSCIKAMINSRMADSVVAAEYCDCTIEKMFELYSYEEIMQWGQLSRDERIARENKINEGCLYILESKDTLQ